VVIVPVGYQENLDEPLKLWGGHECLSRYFFYTLLKNE
jgi:hypothetical protein